MIQTVTSELSQPHRGQWKQALLKACSRLIPDVYRPPAGVLFPYAHIVSDFPPLHVKHLYEIPCIIRFRATLDYLCHRYEPLELKELGKITSLRKNRGSARYFLLSFDDGMREVYDIIAPILREKGIPAIFFLNSATIDNKQLMWRHKISLLLERAHELPRRIPPQLRVPANGSLCTKLKALRFAEEPVLDDLARFYEIDFAEYLRNSKPYLTTSQVQELSAAGFEFGAHSDNHPYFNQIIPSDQKTQISDSVNFIRAIGIPCRCFAFPFNDHEVPNYIFRYMKDLNILASFGTSEARIDSVDFSFQRFALDANNAKSNFRDVLKQLSAQSLVRRLVGTELIHRN